MKVIVTGRGGQVALELEKIHSNNKNWIFLSKEDLNISNLQSVKEYLNDKSIRYVVNCAAYTNAEQAEKEKSSAFNTNAIGPKNLAQVCNLYSINLLHISTDYVFNGLKEMPYVESDLPDPLNFYGISKHQGEKNILESNAKSVIIRTSWVYSVHSNSFVKSMLELAKTKKSLKIVCDQYGSPTSAKELATIISKVISSKEYKWKKGGEIFHFSSNGKCSWYDFAYEIFKIKNIDITLEKISLKEYPTNFVRPKYSALNNEKISNKFGLKINDWKHTLNTILSNN